MKRTICRRVALLMLAIFIANIGIAHLRTQWLHHDLDHTLNGKLVSLMDQHADEDDHGILTGAEHQLLHAADHGQPLPASMSATLQVWAIATILIFSLLASRVPESVFPAPFRPPRRSSI